MAETLVLANFTIDSTGVVKAADTSSKAISGAEKVVTGSSYRMNTSISRLVFGIGGAAAAFLFLHRTITSAFSAAIEEDRKLAKLGLSTGELSSTIDQAASAWGRFKIQVGTVLLDSDAVLDFIKGATGALKQFNEASGGPRRSMREAVAGRTGLPDPGAVNIKRGAEGAAFEKRFDQMARGLQDVTVKADIFRVAVEGNTEAMDNFLTVGDGIEHLGSQMSELNGIIAENQKAWFRSQEAIQQWKILAADAAAVGIQSLSGVLLGTENLTRQWAANTLAAMVPVFLGYAAMGVVQGILGIEGGWVAAAKAGIAAVAAAAASRALGGPGGNTGGFEGGGGGGGGRGVGSRSNGNPAAVSIVIQGSLIGTNPDELARDLSRIIRTNQGDGSR